MSNFFNIDLSEFQPLLKKLDELPEELLDEVDGEIEEAANMFVQLAKNSIVLNDHGRLRNSVVAKRAGAPLAWEVAAKTNYAAYHEWGTIERVSVPPDLVDIAIKYKGRGIRKRGGIRPQNYFFSQRAIVIPALVKRVEEAIKRVL